MTERNREAIVPDETEFVNQVSSTDVSIQNRAAVLVVRFVAPDGLCHSASFPS